MIIDLDARECPGTKSHVWCTEQGILVACVRTVPLLVSADERGHYALYYKKTPEVVGSVEIFRPIMPVTLQPAEWGYELRVTINDEWVVAETIDKGPGHGTIRTTSIGFEIHPGGSSA